jgi:hypothetical protein
LLATPSSTSWTSSRAFDVTTDATAAWCDLRAFIAAGDDAFGLMAARV